MASRYDLDRAGLAALPALAGQPAYRAGQVWDALWSRGEEPSAATNLPAALRTALAAEPDLRPALSTAAVSEGDDGMTTKWLWSLEGGASVETVLMHYRDGRSTVCVSTQAGCAMACGFCATGQAGFTRHLTTGEIVEQVVRARRAAAHGGRRLSNVVFMGMGEPLANYDRVWPAVRLIHDELGLSARHLTISTVGIVPGIDRLASESLPVNLAVSLHAANDTLRDELVPINKRYPLTELIAACRRYLMTKRRRLSFEWALIDGVNDRASDAAELGDIVLGLGAANAHVNLIPLNPTPGWPTVGTPPDRVRQFHDRLVGRGVNATVRHNRGTAIDAACGQLAARTPVAAPRLPH